MELGAIVLETEEGSLGRRGGEGSQLRCLWFLLQAVCVCAWGVCVSCPIEFCNFTNNYYFLCVYFHSL